jgi:O-antigen/teichoic acid export membrane protein
MLSASELLRRGAVRSVLTNVSWLMFEKLVRIALALLVSAWIARHLGPNEFGRLAYVLAFTALFQAIVNLGVDGIVVRDLARDTNSGPRALGTVLGMRLAAGAICWLVGILVIALSASDEAVLFAIAGAALVFQPADTVDLWFQSQSKSQRTAIVRIGALLLSNAIKVGLILSQAPLGAFATMVSIEAALIATGLAYAYRGFPTRGRWQARAESALRLLRESWPFLLGNVSIVVYMRIDQVLIRRLLGEEQLGIYAAAISLSQVWHIVPMTLVISLAPFIARKKADGEAQYQEALLMIFRTFGAVAIVACIVTAVAAPFLVQILFGDEYRQSSPILAIHIFSLFFVFQGCAQGLWFTNERAGRVALRNTLLGGIAAIVANLVLLPRLGAIGGAVAAVISFGIGSVFANAISQRRILLMQLGIRPR